MKKSLAIIGAGTMGVGIAQVFLQAGFKVLLLDIDPNILKEAEKRIEDIYSLLVEKEKISPGDRDAYLSNLKPATDLEILKDIPLIVEAVKEDLQIKKRLLVKVEEVVPEYSIITSNTSSFSINRLASGLKKPGRFMGLHFFNPAPLLPLVEVIMGEKTLKKVKDKIIGLLKSIDLEPVEVKDSPGFIVNRLLIPYINKAVDLLSEAVASRDDIDKAMRLGANHPMGPLELADHIGLDICLNIMENFYEDSGNSGYKPSDLLKKMVSSGKLGEKTGEGFYNYYKRR